jgi:hypothetical protein
MKRPLFGISNDHSGTVLRHRRLLRALSFAVLNAILAINRKIHAIAPSALQRKSSQNPSMNCRQICTMLRNAQAELRAASIRASIPVVFKAL